MDLTIGKEYDVLALVQFGALAMVQILGDDDAPAWEPAWFFEVVDSTLPSDWIGNTIYDGRSLAIGPEFVVKDTESYEQMVSLEPEPVARFWERVERLEKDHATRMRIVEILGEIAAELEPAGTVAAAARWREQLTALASTLAVRQPELDAAQRAHLSNTFFDTPDSLVHFSLDAREASGASQTNTRLRELVAALCEAMST